MLFHPQTGQEAYLLQMQMLKKTAQQSRVVAKRKKMEKSLLLMLLLSLLGLALAHTNGFGEQPLSKISIHRTTLALNSNASVIVSPSLVGKGEDTEWVTVDLGSPNSSSDDWIGVFSPAKFK